MKKYLLIGFVLIINCRLSAQTWDGSAGTDWNDPNNWTPASVPVSTSNAHLFN